MTGTRDDTRMALGVRAVVATLLATACSTSGRLDELTGRADQLETRLDAVDERLRDVEVALGKVDQRLRIIERNDVVRTRRLSATASLGCAPSSSRATSPAADRLEVRMHEHPGWELLIRTAAQTASAQRPVEWRRSVDAAGGLVLAPLDLRGLDLERVRGTVVAARALSREICELCGAPGDPVWPAGGRGGTRCAGCRCAGDEVLPRDDAWRRERDPERERRDPDAPRGSYRQYAVLEDDPGFDAVMDAGYHPDDERGWFGNGVQGGWRHLVRAAFTLLVREQAGPRPGRLSEVKEKWGSLRLSWVGGTSFHLAVLELVERLSDHVCYMCGRPAQMRDGPWVHPACDPCEARHLADQRRPFGQVRRVLANRRRFQGLASEAVRRERRAWMAAAAAKRRAARRRRKRLVSLT